MKTSKKNKDKENKKKAKPVKNATNKIGNKNNTKHKKARANFIKNFKSFKKINIIRSLNGSIEIKNENKKETQKNNIEESLLKTINNAKNMLDTIGYLQLWWKTMFQINFPNLVEISRPLLGQIILLVLFLAFSVFFNFFNFFLN